MRPSDLCVLEGPRLVPTMCPKREGATLGKGHLLQKSCIRHSPPGNKFSTVLSLQATKAPHFPPQKWPHAFSRVLAGIPSCFAAPAMHALTLRGVFAVGKARVLPGEARVEVDYSRACTPIAHGGL